MEFGGQEPGGFMRLLKFKPLEQLNQTNGLFVTTGAFTAQVAGRCWAMPHHALATYRDLSPRNQQCNPRRALTRHLA
jgi:hypothetical protein